jgi:response regulator RpfG family c-di-GMP phosphodiesterase
VTRSKIVAAGGTHFDPVVVEAFCAIEESFRQIDEALRGEESETEHSMVVSGQR